MEILRKTGNQNQINVNTKYGTGPTENDIIVQWNQDILVSSYFKKYC